MAVDVVEIWSSLRAQIEAHRQSTRDLTEVRPAETTPVALLTGFLGAGKSTILAHLLQNPRGLRIRALVNDVGSLPFDPSLVGLSTSVHVELTNGCGCCTSTDDLATSLNSLVDDGDCDLVVLEASGAADPRILMHVVAANRALRLDRVVTVVHATTMLSNLFPESTAGILTRQIVGADCIVVSGFDVLSESECRLALEEAARRAPGRVVTSSKLDQPASHVLLPSSMRGASPFVAESDHRHEAMCVVTVDPCIPLTISQLGCLLEDSRPGLLRAKGRLVADGRYVSIQVTPHSIVIDDADPGPTGITLIANDRSAIEPVLDHLSRANL